MHVYNTLPVTWLFSAKSMSAHVISMHTAEQARKVGVGSGGGMTGIHSNYSDPSGKNLHVNNSSRFLISIVLSCTIRAHFFTEMPIFQERKE